MNRILIATVILAFCTSCKAQETKAEQLLEQSEPAIQELISRVLDVRGPRVDYRRSAVGSREIQSLYESTADKGELVKEIAVFATSSGESKPLLARMVLDMLDLPPKITIRVLAPHLGSENKNLRSFVRDWFHAHDICAKGPSGLLALNYEDYRNYVRGQIKRDEEVPTAFIEYLYDRSPGRALIVFHYANPIRHYETVANLLELQKQNRASQLQREKTELDKNFPPKMMSEEEFNEIQQRVDQQLSKSQLTSEEQKQQRREVLLAEQLVSHAIWLQDNDYDLRFLKTALPEAKEHLKKLSRHEGWWARLYVAEIMRRHREFRLDEVLERLSKDDNGLVRKTAKSAMGQSAAAPIAPQEDAALIAPRGVEARAVGPRSIKVTWEASVGATSYAVQRRRAGSETEFTTIAPNVTGTSYTDSGLVKDALYEYRVMAQQNR